MYYLLIDRDGVAVELTGSMAFTSIGPFWAGETVEEVEDFAEALERLKDARWQRPSDLTGRR